jgi:hypothetical protein
MQNCMASNGKSRNKKDPYPYNLKNRGQDICANEDS